MPTPNTITAIATLSAALLAAGCATSSTEPTQATVVQQATSHPAELPTIDLGEVELVAQSPKTVSLGGGKDCVITPSILADGRLQMDLSVERKRDDGTTQRQVQFTLTSPSGERRTISVGDTHVSFIPRLKTP